MGHVEEASLEDGEFTGAEVALALDVVTFEVVGALAENLTSGSIVLHGRLHAVLLDGADLHADAATEVAGHDGPAALEVELVLLDAAPPDLVAHEGAAGAAVDADLADLTEGVDAVVHRAVIGDVGVGGNHHDAAAGADVGGQQVAASAQLAEAGRDEHRDVGAGVVVGAVHLGAVAQAADEVAQFQAGRAFGAVGAGVDDFGVDAGDGLGGLEVLLVGQADDVGEADPVLLALIDVADVESGDADFDEAEFAGLLLDGFGDVLAGGIGGGFEVAGQAGSHDEVAVELVVFLADFAHLGVLVAEGVGPVAGGALGDVHGFDGILAGVPVDFALVHGDAGSGFELLGHRDGDRRVAQILTGTPYLMTDG